MIDILIQLMVFKFLMLFSFFDLEGIGVHLVLKIMGKVGVYYLVEDIDLTPAIVLLGLNPCEAANVILW